MRSLRLVRKTLVSVLTVGALALLAPRAAHAAPVVGTLGWTGTGVLTFSTGGGASGTNFIDWCPVNVGPDPAAGCGVSATGLGDIEATTRTLSFTMITASDTGTIVDQTDVPGDPSPYTTITPGPNNITDWITFSSQPTWTFTLTNLDPQVCAPSATIVCTGVFQLIQSGANVGVLMSGSGTIDDGLGNITLFTMLISANFPGTTIAAVIAGASSSDGIFNPSWSGSLTATAIPEPGTLLLFGSGAALVARRLRRRRKA